ncbi:MAG: TIGR03943 family protein [Desulfobacterales bacterium]|nr:MAG: TIGR03943 family protein [Desulfobacterales bacterium]
MKEKVKNTLAVFSVCLPAITFIVWIAAYCWLLNGDRYKAFMQPKLRPMLILALLLLLIFVMALISQLSRKKKETNITDVWLRTAILFVPALFLWTVYGQSLGAYALSKKTFDADEIFSIPQTQPEQLSIMDSSVKSASLLDLLKNSDEFEGTHVATEGMVFRSNTIAENTFKIFRFAIICCAADALPLWILVNSEESQNLENETWVKVEGIFKIKKINGRQIPHIDAEAVQPITTPAPEKQYLFFY